MDYQAWKLFMDAAEFGSLSKVALAYGTSQPQISRKLSELEEECGGRLFQRTGRGVVLTEFGQRLAPKVRHWLASTEQLANDVHETAGRPIGKVRLGILPSTAYPLVTRLHYRLREHHPLVQLSVREGQGAQLEAWLENGSVDLALLFRFAPSPRDGDVYLIRTATYLVGPIGDPLTAAATAPFSALNRLPLVMFCRPSSWRDHLDQLALEHGIELNVAVEADSLSLQTHIVADGGAHAILGPYAIAAASRDCALQSARLVDPEVTRYIALAMSRHGEMTLACRTVMQFTRDIAQALADGK